MSRQELIETFTNLVYPAAGASVLLFEVSPMSIVFSVAMLLLGLASAQYHSGVEPTADGDVSAMYVVGFVLIAHVWGFYGWWGALTALGGALALGPLLRYGTKDVPMERKVGAVYGVLAFSTLLFVGPTWLLGGAVLLFATALAFRFKVTAWWGHSVWHLLTGPGMLLLYLAGTDPVWGATYR